MSNFMDPFSFFENDPFFREAFSRFPRSTGNIGLLEGPQGQTQSLAPFRGGPRMDVIENEKGYNIKADLPGLEKKDVRLSLNDDLLTIEGERSEEKFDKTATRHVFERSFGKFSRSFRLPPDVKPETCHASMENGVLNIWIDKRPSSESGRRRIDIK